MDTFITSRRSTIPRKKRTTARAFTIVELLIVIVVIAILAAISMVAYTGIQASARDSQRQQDMNTIAKALEMYYIDNGRYPTSGGSSAINAGWSTTADSSWAHLESQLVPKYITEFPKDPVSTPDTSVLDGKTRGSNYAYFTVTSVGYCGKVNGQMYALVYRNESAENANRRDGDCPTNALAYYGNGNSSNIQVIG